MGSNESRRSILERHENAIASLKDALRILEAIEPNGDSLRELIVQFLGASRALEARSRRVALDVESDPHQVEIRKTIQQSLLTFWASGRAAIDEANASFEQLKAGISGVLSGKATERSWDTPEHMRTAMISAIRTIREPWQTTQHCEKYADDALAEFVLIARNQRENHHPDSIGNGVSGHPANRNPEAMDTDAESIDLTPEQRQGLDIVVARLRTVLRLCPDGDVSSDADKFIQQNVLGGCIATPKRKITEVEEKRFRQELADNGTLFAVSRLFQDLDPDTASGYSDQTQFPGSQVWSCYNYVSELIQPWNRWRAAKHQSEDGRASTSIAAFLTPEEEQRRPIAFREIRRKAEFLESVLSGQLNAENDDLRPAPFEHANGTAIQTTQLIPASKSDAAGYVSRTLSNVLGFATYPQPQALSESWWDECKTEVVRVTDSASRSFAGDELKCRKLTEARTLAFKFLGLLFHNPTLSTVAVQDWPLKAYQTLFDDLSALQREFRILSNADEQPTANPKNEHRQDGIGVQAVTTESAAGTIQDPANTAPVFKGDWKHLYEFLWTNGIRWQHVKADYEPRFNEYRDAYSKSMTGTGIEKTPRYQMPYSGDAKSVRQGFRRQLEQQGFNRLD